MIIATATYSVKRWKLGAVVRQKGARMTASLQQKMPRGIQISGVSRRFGSILVDTYVVQVCMGYK